MSTDRELLKLAAKAAGYAVDCGFADCPLIFGEDAGPDGPREWNPFTDDGDALRLAVKLKLEILFFDGFGEIAVERNNGDHMQVTEHYCDDMNATTRRAIVRAAAAIGESMP